MGKRKLLLTGATIQELRTECEEFLKETSPYSYPTPQPVPHLSTDDERQLPLVPHVSHSGREVTHGVEIPLKTTTTTATSDVDSRGIPWDQRVHSSSKEKTKDGSWRKRRGVEDADLYRIEGELRGTTPASPVPVVVAPPVPMGNVSLPPVASPVPVAAVIPLVQPTAAPSIAMSAQTPSAPVGPPMTQAPVAPPQPVTLAHSFGTFKTNLVPVLAELVKRGSLNQEYVAALKVHFNVDEIWKCNETQLAEMFETFATHGLIQKVTQ